MPTIVIKNGNKSLKLTKREREAMELTQATLSDVSVNFLGYNDQLGPDISKANEAIDDVLALAEQPARKTT